MITYGYVFGPSTQNNTSTSTSTKQREDANKSHVDRGLFIDAYNNIDNANTMKDVATLAKNEAINYRKSLSPQESVISTHMFSDFQQSVSNTISGGHHRYLVYIPVLNGVPNSKQEKEFFRWLQENRKKREEAKEDIQKYEQLGKELGDSRKFNGAELNIMDDFVVSTTMSNIKNIIDTKTAFFMDASVCAHPGVSVRYNPGDLVVVGFIDNAMDRPIILGELSNDAKEVSDAIMCGIDNINTKQICATDYMEIPQKAKIKCKKEANELPEEYDVQQLVDLLKSLEQIQIMVSNEGGGAQSVKGIDALSYFVRTLGPSINIIASLCEKSTAILSLLQLTS